MKILVFLADTTLYVGWITDTLDYIVKSGPSSGEMYLSAMEVSIVPFPAATWLFGHRVNRFHLVIPAGGALKVNLRVKLPCLGDV